MDILRVSVYITVLYLCMNVCLYGLTYVFISVYLCVWICVCQCVCLSVCMCASMPGCLSESRPTLRPEIATKFARKFARVLRSNQRWTGGSQNNTDADMGCDKQQINGYISNWALEGETRGTSFPSFNGATLARAACARYNEGVLLR